MSAEFEISGLIAPEHYCFYCSRHIPKEQGMVMWHGHDSLDQDDGCFIALHRKCANFLAVNLIQDATKLAIQLQKKGLAGYPRQFEPGNETDLYRIKEQK